MGLAEKLGRFVPNNFKKPLTPGSYDEFVNALCTHDVSRIVAVPGRKALFRTGSVDLGEDGVAYEYNIAFDSTSSTGRKINYYYPCTQKFLDNPDYHYAHGGKMRGERLIRDLEEAYSLTTIVTADVKLQELQQMFPGCTTELRDADKIFTQEDYEELRRVAQRRQIRPWDPIATP
jgi:hypothetical protein